MWRHAVPCGAKCGARVRAACVNRQWGAHLKSLKSSGMSLSGSSWPRLRSSTSACMQHAGQRHLILHACNHACAVSLLSTAGVQACWGAGVRAWAWAGPSGDAHSHERGMGGVLFVRQVRAVSVKLHMCARMHACTCGHGTSTSTLHSMCMHASCPRPARLRHGTAGRQDPSYPGPIQMRPCLPLTLPASEPHLHQHAPERGVQQQRVRVQQRHELRSEAGHRLWVAFGHLEQSTAARSAAEATRLRQRDRMHRLASTRELIGRSGEGRDGRCTSATAATAGW